MRLGSLIAALGVIFLVLFFGANGYVPVPDPVRQMWDKAWGNHVEPAKEKAREKYEEIQEQSEAPEPARANLGAPQFQIMCTVPVCTAA